MLPLHSAWQCIMQQKSRNKEKGKKGRVFYVTDTCTEKFRNLETFTEKQFYLSARNARADFSNLPHPNFKTAITQKFTKKSQNIENCVMVSGLLKI